MRNRLLSFVRVPLTLSVAIVVLAVLLGRGNGPLASTVTVAVVNMVFVVALYIFVGNSGIQSFGHLSFATVGGYVAGITVLPLDLKRVILPELPSVLGSFALAPFAAILAGGLVSAIFGLLVILPLSRINGLAAGLATVSLLIAVNVVASNWESVTNGTKALSNLPVSTTLGSGLLWAVVVVWAAWFYQRSPSGKRLRASKSDEVAAVSAGIRIGRERVIAFTISAFFTGVAGGLFALQLGSVTPNLFYLQYTFLIIVMLVVGGTDSLSGAVVGGIVVSVLSEVLRRAETGDLLGIAHVKAHPGLENVGLGIAMVLILLLRPSGITGGRELAWPKWARHAAGTAASAQAKSEAPTLSGAEASAGQAPVALASGDDGERKQ